MSRIYWWSQHSSFIKENGEGAGAVWRRQGSKEEWVGKISQCRSKKVPARQMVSY
jgi:hypothetical protein